MWAGQIWQFCPYIKKSMVQETEEPIDDDALNNLVRFKIDPDDFPDGIDWSTQTW